MSIWNLKVMQITGLTAPTQPTLIAAYAAPSSVIFCRIAPYGDDEPAQLKL